MTRDDALRVGTAGLPEAIRRSVLDAYKGLGGTIGKVDVARLRQAMKEVRRGLENKGRWDGADELTRREDALAAATGE